MHKTKNQLPAQRTAEVEVLTQEQTAAREIRAAFDAANRAVTNATRQVVLCGVLMLEAKKLCKHGEFGPWLHKHCFQDDTTQGNGKYDPTNRPWWRAATRYMEVASNVLASKGLLSGETLALGNGDEVPLKVLLQRAPEELPEEGRRVQMEFWAEVDGKSQRELLGIKEPRVWTYHPPGPKPPPDEVAAAAKKYVNDEVARLANMIKFLMEETHPGVRHLSMVDMDHWQYLEEQRLELGRWLKKFLAPNLVHPGRR